MPRWLLPILLLAALHLAGGFVGIALEILDPPESASVLSPWSRLLIVATFAGCGGFLLAAGRGDRRAALLASALLLFGVSYARQPLRLLAAELGDGTGALLTALFRLPPDALLPAVAWLFFVRFPRIEGEPAGSRFGAMAARVALVVCSLLLAANLLLVLPLPDALHGALAPLSAQDPFALYWTLEYGLLLPSLAYCLARARHAAGDELSRILLLVSAMLAAGIPMSASIIVTGLSPAASAFFQQPAVAAVWHPVIQILVLSVPVTATYAVLVNRAFDVRPVLRSAVRYALARGTVVFVVSLPFIAFLWTLYGFRDASITEVLSTPRSLGLLVSMAIGVVALRWRERARDAVDRTFFREQVDSRRVLSELAQRMRGVLGTDDLAEAVRRHVDEALHLERIAVLVRTPGGHELRAPAGEARSLAADSALLRQLERQPEPQAVDLERPRPWLAGLPEADRQWLADGGFLELAPMVDSLGAVHGLIGLGPKRSELEFSPSDRLFLSAVASSASLALENLRMRSSGAWLQDADARTGEAPDPRRAPESELLAGECPDCRRVWPITSQHCGACQGALVPADLPCLLLGKFRFERRIGEGAMGVVYRAVDVDLGRTVAVKTLPRVSPERSLRLRREARTMASVLHPNLALVFGLESWRGVPMLICELLEQGTLADRMASGPMKPAEVAALGASLSEGLAALHEGGILHRDVKPSNVGYGAGRTPKLLDFGLARMLGEGGRSETGSPPPRDDAVPPLRSLDVPSASLSATVAREGVVGTPLYLSPEALWNASPDTSFDLWSLVLVLYECVAGRNPIERPLWADTVDRIVQVDIPDVREHAPDCPEVLAGFFAAALPRDRERRPRDARVLASQLADVARRLDAG